MSQKKPFYGTGLEFEFQLHEPILENLGNMDCLEVIPENFFYAGKLQGKDTLKTIKDSDIPVMVHGVNLNIGAPDPLDQAHLDDMKRIMDQFNTANYSEHLCMTGAGEVEIGQLTPLPWSNDYADFISEKIMKIQNQIDVPFMIENITNRFIYPDTEISEIEFINRIIDNTGCGMCLDVTNTYTNSVNHHFDPYEWIDQVRHGSVHMTHLAGGKYDKDGILEDSHDNAVFEQVWELYQYTLTKTGKVTTIVERTGNVPKIDFLFDELKRADGYMSKYDVMAPADFTPAMSL